MLIVELARHRQQGVWRLLDELGADQPQPI
jgi:hypothetical protein